MVTFGTMTGPVLQTADRLARDGISAEVVKLNRLVPLPAETALASLQKTRRLLVVQECVTMGSPGEGLLAAATSEGISLKKAKLCSCGEGFLPHGTVPQLRSLCGLDGESLYQNAREVVCNGG